MVERPLPRHMPVRTEAQAVKALVVDDHPLVREALVKVLAELGPRVEVLQAANIERALAELEAHPDTTLILLELTLPDADGTRGLERVRRIRPNVPVVIFSALDNRSTVLAALDSGAKGFISKRSSAAVLVCALRLVLTGQVYVPREALQAEPAAKPTPEPCAVPASTRPATGGDLGLTQRQMEVLTLLVQGKPSKVISRELGCAEATVKAHIAAIFRALGVSNRTEAGFAFTRLGLQLPFAPAASTVNKTDAWRPAPEHLNGARLRGLAAPVLPLRTRSDRSARLG